MGDEKSCSTCHTETAWKESKYDKRTHPKTLPLANGAKISAGSVKVGNASADFTVTLGVSIDKGTKAKFGVYVPQDTSVKTLTMNVAEKNGLSEDPTFVIRPVKTDL